MLLQALHDQLFGGPVGFRHQIVFAFHFEGDAALEVIAEQRSGFVRDRGGGLGETNSCDLVEILDVVLEDEEVGRACAGDADEALVVILHDAVNLFVVG